MKWGRQKKPDPPSGSTATPRPPSRLASLLLRFKKMGAKGPSSTSGSGSGECVGNEPGKVNLSAGLRQSPERFTGGGRRGEVYYEDEAFWSLSFRKDKVDGRVRELLGDTVEDPGEAKNFDQMVSGIRRMREVQRKEGSLMELKTLRQGKLRGRNSGSRSRVGVENWPDSSWNRRKDFICPATGLKEVEHLTPELVRDEDQLPVLRSVDPKSERQRKSPHMSRASPKRRTRPSCRVRIHSPRSTSGSEMRPSCRVRIQSPRPVLGLEMRAAEPAKRAKPKSKKKSKEKGIGLERFAVVKSTSDPHRDFRNSMIEMILERRIRRPKELEELLACYLTLNPDEYHEVIIKVFRQIWFELNQASCCECDASELPTEEDWY